MMDGPLSGTDNMRIDQELLDGQKASGAWPVLRFFQWNRPTVSYGRTQDPVWVGMLVKSEPRGFQVTASDDRQAGGMALLTHRLVTNKGAMDVVRRPTGGGMVRHHKDLSLSLVWRRNHPGMPQCLKDVYRTIHDMVRVTLRQRAIETTFYKPTQKAQGAPGFCFVEPAEDDLMLDGKKILGGAVRVTGWGRLYQGNLLTAPLGLSAEALAENIAKVFENYFFRSAPASMETAKQL